MGHRALLSAAGVVAWVACFAACLEDLPPAATCPPAAQIPGSSCVAALNRERTQPECFTAEDVQCLTGPRPTAGCVVDECASDGDACWPDGDCPPTVIDRFGQDTVCRRLPGEAYGFDAPSAFMCMHRCASCAAVCDGVGPVLGMLGGLDFQIFPLLVETGSRMPDRGKLGIYMRVRGLANFQVLIGKGDTYLEDLSKIELTGASYFVLTPLGTDFVEQTLFDDDFLGIQAYEWERREDRPTLIVILPPGSDTEVGQALYEIDCIVPFVVD